MYERQWLVSVYLHAAKEMERLKLSYEELERDSSNERFELQDKIYKLRNELQDTKDRMAAEQIVLGKYSTASYR